MNTWLFFLLRDSLRLAFYTLVAGPALLLYFIAVTFVLDSSPSQQFLDAARRLTDGAPVGKVMQCAGDDIRSHELMPLLTEGVPPPVTLMQQDEPPMEPTPHPVPACHRVPVDSGFWTRPADFLLTIIWLTAALCGAVYGFMAVRRSHPNSVSPEAAILHKKEHHDER